MDSKIFANVLEHNTIEETSAISKCKIIPLTEAKNGVVAIATVSFYDKISINSISININPNTGELYVRMPQKRTQQGNYIDVAHPLTGALRHEINHSLIENFKSKNYEVSNNTVPVDITAKNCVKYEAGKYGNNLARLDVVIGDMVVHNCKINNNKDNKPFLSMPNYKDKTGQYHSLVTPNSKEVYKTMTAQAVSEFKDEFSYRKCSDADVAILKNENIEFTTNKNAEEVNIVKFKTADLKKINAILNSKTVAVAK